jgi:aromatic-L-amino-acid decarboxylase
MWTSSAPRSCPSCCSAVPGWGAEDYHRWSEKLLADQIGFVTPTRWEGETVARFAFLNPDTTVEIVDEILATMR